MVQRSWSELSTAELYSILKVRTDVFLTEQRVEDIELDDRDQEPTTEHFFVADERGVAAYARVLVDPEPEHLDARIVVGRVVTRADRRGEGLAHRVVQAAVAAHEHEAQLLHAQDYVQGLYARSGFVAFGEPYREAGIPHVSMYRAAR